jgi:hypothetical protein
MASSSREPSKPDETPDAGESPYSDKALQKHVRYIMLNGDVHDFRKVRKLHPDLDLGTVVDPGRDWTPLMLACSNPHAFEMVRVLVEEERVDIHAKHSELEIAPLHIACKNGADMSAEILLDAGASVTDPDVSARARALWCCLC